MVLHLLPPWQGLNGSGVRPFHFHQAWGVGNDAPGALTSMRIHHLANVAEHWTMAFPHVLVPSANTPTLDFCTQWCRSNTMHKRLHALTRAQPTTLQVGCCPHKSRAFVCYTAHLLQPCVMEDDTSCTANEVMLDDPGEHGIYCRGGSQHAAADPGRLARQAVGTQAPQASLLSAVR